MEAKKPQKSVDPDAVEILTLAETMGLSTAFSRADAMKPCPIGSDGLCCKNCSMGPCRLVKPGARGICGATIETVVSRNLARAIAAGASAHSDHGRDLAFTLQAVAQGEAQGYEVRDAAKLMQVAAYMGIKTEGRAIKDITLDVANAAVAQFGQQKGELIYVKRAPKKRQELWKQTGITPRGIDREVVEVLHRTHMGDDQDANHILLAAMRTALSDGWGGSMLATDLTDILFGTPSPVVSQVNLGVLKTDEVNIVVHGHEPTLSEMIVTAVQDPELIEYAKSKGAKGINLCGLCCTSNETLMRQGIPSAGNFLNQELAIITGAVDAMVVDVQCIMQALPDLAKNFHTKVITTSPKVYITGSTYMPFDEHHALDIAKQIVRASIDAYTARGETHIPASTTDMVPGFSHEYLGYMQGGMMRGSFRPLNDAIMAGRIRGVAAVVGCNNPRSCQDLLHNQTVQQFLKNDVLVVQTGCGALANAKYGLLQGEALDYCGPGLREVCEAIGIPPVLHMGSCVDNSRILTVLSQMASEGGLGEDISDIPAVGLAPEWMSEKALAIGTYCAASGAYVLFGTTSPVEGSPEVGRIMTEEWEKMLGGKLEFEPDVEKLVEKSLAHIDQKRAALGLPEYDSARFGKSGDARMNELLGMSPDERANALYGTPAVRVPVTAG